MLYEYNGKIYIKPLVNKIAEVKISKKGDEYDIQPTGKIIYITDEIKKEWTPVSKENAYELQKSIKSNKIDL